MPVKPEVQEILDFLALAGLPSPAQLTPEQLRASYAAMPTAPGEDVASVEDRVVDGPHGPIPIRIYQPVEQATSPPGVLVWFHGGGFVIGDIASSDPTARALANAAGVVVVSVDYHLAPEFPFPAAVDDAFTALQWVASAADELGVDATKIAVGGDSAGANLAAVTCQIAHAAKAPPIAFQLLVYPVVDLAGTYPSTTENGEGYFLTQELMNWFRSMYLGGRDATHPRVSPIHSSSLRGLPAAFVLTAEYDPLRDEGETYAAALSEAGVAVEAVRYDGMIHGFFTMDQLEDCGEARRHAGAALRAALA